MEQKAQIRPSLPLSNPTTSYWQDPPDQEVADLRSTESLSQSAEYVIVGSGISGVSIANGLLERLGGKGELIMLEARQAVSGATGRNGGHTKAATYRSYPHFLSVYGRTEAMKIARLEHENIVSTHAFARTHKIPCESRPCNTVDIVYDQASYDAGIESIKLMREHFGADDPVAEYKIYDAEEARREFLCEGDCDGESVKGAFEYLGGSVSAYKFAVGILKMALKKGLNLQTNTPVTRIQPLDGGKWRVQTPRGAIDTKNLVLATNGYTSHLLPELQLYIVPVRGQVTAQRPGATMKRLAPSGIRTTVSFIYSNGYEYMIQRPYNNPHVPAEMAGDFIIGGGLRKLPQEGLSEVGECDDTKINPLNREYLKGSLAGYYGKNWGEDDTAGRIRTEWTGIMGFTPDELPFVGAVPGQKGLWVCAGFNGHGMVLCLKSSAALVHMLTGDTENAYSWFPESFRITTERLKSDINKVGENTKHGASAPQDVDIERAKSKL